MSIIDFRVEHKYLVSDLDLSILRQRLSSVMQSDLHQNGDFYEVRSLYFDDLCDNCMNENEFGVNLRKKYRIRTYGENNSPLKLEIKEKQNGLTHKSSCAITRTEFDAFLSDSVPLIFDRRKPFNELLLQMQCSRMRPKIIILYERSAFVHPTGNVRITFDRNISACADCDAFFDESISGFVPVLPSGMHILEVKYDELLPDTIARQLEIGTLQQTTFSKYYLGRKAVHGDFLTIP